MIKSATKVRKEGFWYSGHGHRDWPMPQALKSKWPGYDEFLSKLIQIEDSYMNAFLLATKQYNADYEEFRRLHGGVPPHMRPQEPTFPEYLSHAVACYMGSSRCRICDKQNGSREYHIHGWIWPEGFRHYVEVHNVKPSDDFIKFIMEEAVTL